MRHLAIVLASVIFVCIAPAAMANSTYSFQTIINPADPAFTQLLGINNSGTITGYFGDGSVVTNNGFTLVPPNSFTSENFPGSVQTQVIGINNSGETVGFYVDAGGTTHGFTDVGGTFTTIDDPLGSASPLVTQLLGVNNAGTAAGYYVDAGGNFHPFTYSGGTFTAVSFSGEVSAQATGINNSGDVTGFNMTGSTTSNGFLDIGGSFTQLQFPGSVFTQALGLNNDGDVVGFYVDAAGNTHGFVYNIATQTYQDIDDPNAVGPGGTVVNGINDKGQIVGFYSDANGNTDGFTGTPTATPEPSSVFLLGASLLGLVCATRRKRFA